MAKKEALLFGNTVRWKQIRKGKIQDLIAQYSVWNRLPHAEWEKRIRYEISKDLPCGTDANDMPKRFRFVMHLQSTYIIIICHEGIIRKYFIEKSTYPTKGHCGSHTELICHKHNEINALAWRNLSLCRYVFIFHGISTFYSVGCRSPPFGQNFYIFENSDRR